MVLFFKNKISSITNNFKKLPHLSFLIIDLVLSSIKKIDHLKFKEDIYLNNNESVLNNHFIDNTKQMTIKDLIDSKFNIHFLECNKIINSYHHENESNQLLDKSLYGHTVSLEFKNLLRINKDNEKIIEKKIVINSATSIKDFFIISDENTKISIIDLFWIEHYKLNKPFQNIKIKNFWKEKYLNKKELYDNSLNLMNKIINSEDFNNNVSSDMQIYGNKLIRRYLNTFIKGNNSDINNLLLNNNYDTRIYEGRYVLDLKDIKYINIVNTGKQLDLNRFYQQKKIYEKLDNSFMALGYNKNKYYEIGDRLKKVLIDKNLSLTREEYNLLSNEDMYVYKSNIKNLEYTNPRVKKILKIISDYYNNINTNYNTLVTLEEVNNIENRDFFKEYNKNSLKDYEEDDSFFDKIVS